LATATVSGRCGEQLHRLFLNNNKITAVGTAARTPLTGFGSAVDLSTRQEFLDGAWVSRASLDEPNCNQAASPRDVDGGFNYLMSSMSAQFDQTCAVASPGKITPTGQPVGLSGGGVHLYQIAGKCTGKRV
jgi:hypothetical protein